jgi:ubiquinone/menaquinone biosynthesis C-methylase UbiE
MSVAAEQARAAFEAVHTGLPRAGPGDRASTARALGNIEALPGRPRVLDIGCGPGKQTVDLATLLPAAAIQAVDAHAPFVAEAKRRIAAAGLAGRVSVLRADMRALPFPAATFDLIWCEGAAYIMGVPQALTTWRALLEPGGALAFTEVVWLRPDAPGPLATWWADHYPDMRSTAEHRTLISDCGYRLLSDFVLPEQAWWQDYYRPMAARIAQLRPGYADDGPAQAVLAECEREIDNYRRYSKYYGYLFAVAVRDG